MMLPKCTHICMCENGNEERDTARDLPVSTPKEEEEEEEKTCVCVCVCGGPTAPVVIIVLSFFPHSLNEDNHITSPWMEKHIEQNIIEQNTPSL